ncbi:MAG TPA: tRNA lysidine(34) synthetase TilS, partial [Trinickia sp.]|nr:tRNA lysidine(34) synthetase TilS [Trinickia sp.]
ERMRLAPGASARSLKNLFQERGVPAWQRDVPLIFVGERLLYVPLIGVNGACRSEPPTASGPAQACRRLEWRADLLIA